MPRIIEETITKSSKGIKGTFKLSDNSTTKFEKEKGKDWMQWGNNNDNLCLTTQKVEQLCNEWIIDNS